MNTQIVAVLISEGTKLAGQWLRNRPFHIKTVQKASISSEEPLEQPTEQPQIESPVTKTSGVATGCIPCAMGHFGTCSGLLSESMRFARDDKDGIYSDEVTDRVGKCLDELNTMERVDLTEEKIIGLPEWEKELATQVLVTSRQTRHALESLKDVDDLEQVTANTQITRKDLFRQWVKSRVKNITPEEVKASIKNLTPEDQEKLHMRIMAKLDELGEEDEND